MFFTANPIAGELSAANDLFSIPGKATDAQKIKVPSSGNPECSNVLAFTLEVGQNMAEHTSPVVGKSNVLMKLSASLLALHGHKINWFICFLLYCCT